MQCGKVDLNREMRDISADLRERADLLVRQMVAEEARFRTSLSALENEEAIRRHRLKTALQAVRRAISIVTVQDALRRGLKSAVAALDAQAETSKSRSKNRSRVPYQSLKKAAQRDA